jgi:hypothetical protein
MRYKFNGWDKPIAEQLARFEAKVSAMIRREFGVDADGDPPVQLILVDRTVCESMHYWAVPYKHKAKTQEEKDEIEKTLIVNLKVAADALNNYWKIKQHERSTKS